MSAADPDPDDLSKWTAEMEAAAEKATPASSRTTTSSKRMLTGGRDRSMSAPKPKRLPMRTGPTPVRVGVRVKPLTLTSLKRLDNPTPVIGEVQGQGALTMASLALRNVPEPVKAPGQNITMADIAYEDHPLSIQGGNNLSQNNSLATHNQLQLPSLANNIAPSIANDSAPSIANDSAPSIVSEPLLIGQKPSTPTHKCLSRLCLICELQ
jgi:hypothetical protein